MKKPASLGSNLIATKGSAAPISESQITDIIGQNKEKKRIAITVKLLEKPYVRMKTYGASNRISNQDILEKALDEFLEKYDK